MDRQGNVASIFRGDRFAARLAEARIIAREPKEYAPSTVKAAAIILAASREAGDRRLYCKIVGIRPGSDSPEAA